MTTIIDGSAGITFPNSTVQASAGSVLQVVNATLTGLVSSSSSTYADTGLTATITPKFLTSKILVLATINGAGKNNSNAGNALMLRLLRGSTTILNIEGIFAYTGTTLAINGTSATTYLDSPATTSATTYKIQFANQANASAVLINNYYVTGSEVNSTITLMEIAG
jgi:hypothetical protein